MTLWTIAHQAPLSIEFPRQEYRSGSLFPSPGELSDLRTEPESPALQVDSLSSEPPGQSCVPITRGSSLRWGTKGNGIQETDRSPFRKDFRCLLANSILNLQIMQTQRRELP